MFWLYLLHVRNSENEDVLLLLSGENIINVLKAGWKSYFRALIKKRDVLTLSRQQMIFQSTDGIFY